MQLAIVRVYLKAECQETCKYIPASRGQEHVTRYFQFPNAQRLETLLCKICMQTSFVQSFLIFSSVLSNNWESLTFPQLFDVLVEFLDWNNKSFSL